VKSLVDENMQEGNHQINWKVNDNNGLEIPSGLYFLKIAAGSYSETIKITIIK
jgi:flagellar hook assembly protein FlgD